MAPPLKFKNRTAKLECKLAPSQAQFVKATIKEGLSQITEAQIEFLCDDRQVDVSVLLGKPLAVIMSGQNKGDADRRFDFHCISVEYLGEWMGMFHYIIEARCWLWFLTRSSDCRIFQEKATDAIISEVMGDYGGSSVVTVEVEQALQRDYCVQYNETYYDFVYRLAAQEGYYFRCDDGVGGGKIVFRSGESSYPAISSGREQEYYVDEGNIGPASRIDLLHRLHATRTKKITLGDFDYQDAGAEKRFSVDTDFSQNVADSEFYTYPARTVDDAAGRRFAKVRMEVEELSAEFVEGSGTTRDLEIGKTFELIEHPDDRLNAKYLVTQIVHEIENELAEGRSNLEDSDDRNVAKTGYRCTFKALPDADKANYRTAPIVPWPRIPGVQTAKVTGPDGEAIYVDDKGRIKAQFHWDRVGENNENSSLWVRCAMPWTGKGWGIAAWPRIGHEVVIQFEEGDPDRPLCTGMVYNSDDAVPYALPDNKTQTLIKTDSMADDTAAFHELVFEDKAEEEFVRLVSERDYFEVIKNNATVQIGLEHSDPGFLKQTIHGDKIETINVGDHILTVKKGEHQTTISEGNQSLKITEGSHTSDIAADRTMTIGGNETIAIGADQSIDIGGGQTENIDGDRDIEVGGNMTLSVGNSLTIDAGMEISLTVGGNSIVIDNSGVTISGTMISVTGDATVDVGSPATTVGGDGMLTLEGGTVMIN